MIFEGILAFANKDVLDVGTNFIDTHLTFNVLITVRCYITVAYIKTAHAEMRS